MSQSSRTFTFRALGLVAATGSALAGVYACTNNDTSPLPLDNDGGQLLDAGFSITNCPNGGVLGNACATCITTSCASQAAAVNAACAPALECACPLGVDVLACAPSSTCASSVETIALQCTTCASACGLPDAGHDGGGVADSGQVNSATPVDASDSGVLADATPEDAPADAPSSDAADTSSPLDASFDAPPLDAYVAYDAGLPPSLVQPAALQLWLRADLGVQSSGAAEPFPVAVWQDLSGNNRTATQLTAASQPLLHTTTPLTGTSSSLPWIEFVPGSGDGNGTDGGSPSLFMGVDLSFLASSPYTILVVSSRYSDKSENYFLGAHFGGGGMDTALHEGWSDDSDFYLGQFGDDLMAQVPSNPATGWQPVLSTAKLDTDAGHFIFLGGNEAANSPSTSPLTIADNGVLGRGYATTPDNTYFAGGLGEIIVYNVALSDGDRQAIEAYLQNRWQIPLQ